MRGRSPGRKPDTAPSRIRAPGASSFSRVVLRPTPGREHVFRRSLLTLGAGLALSGAVLTGSGAHAADITPAQAADYAAGYLGRLMDPTGYVPALSGVSYNDTAWSVL